MNFNFIHVLKSALFVTFIWITITSNAQSAYEGIRYQAILRDASGSIVGAKEVYLRLTIYQKGDLGNGYIETHATSTNALGLINLTIGNGIPNQNTFSSVDWGKNTSTPFFIKVEFSDNGGVTFLTFGESQLLSVPYAMYAKNVENADDADADPLNEIQDLQLTGNLLEITKKGTPTVIDLTRYLDNTDAQVLSFGLDDTLRLTDGGAVYLGIFALKDYIDSRPAKGIDSVLANGNNAGNQLLINLGELRVGTAVKEGNMATFVDSTNATTGYQQVVKVRSNGTNTANVIQSGVYSEISGTNGENIGIDGTSNGNSSGINTGVGGFGSGSANTNRGVHAFGQGGSASYGVFAQAGFATSSTIAVNGNARGNSSSTIVYGVYGQADSLGQFKRGVVGVVAGPVDNNDAAVYGIANGVGSNNIAIYGRANNTANSADTNIALLGDASGASVNISGWFKNGNVFMDDTLFLRYGAQQDYVLTSIGTSGRTEWRALPGNNDNDSLNELITSFTLTNDSIIIKEGGVTGQTSFITLKGYVDTADFNSFKFKIQTDSIAIAGLIKALQTTTNALSLRIVNDSLRLNFHLVNDLDTSITNEIQNLSISNDTIKLSNGGFAKLPSNEINNDNDSTNEYVDSLNFSGNKLYLSQASGSNRDSTDLSSLDQSDDITSLQGALNDTAASLRSDTSRLFNLEQNVAIGAYKDSSSANELLDTTFLTGNVLTIKEAGVNYTTDLSGISGDTTRIAQGNSKLYVNDIDSSIRIMLNGVERYKLTTKSIVPRNDNGAIYIGDAAGEKDSLKSSQSESNVGIGLDVLKNAKGVGNSGGNNVAIGTYTLKTLTTGESNVAIGSSALKSSTTGSSNTAVGARALLNSITGGSNTAVGQNSQRDNTTGSNNTSLGNSSLVTGTTGSGNVVIGAQAMELSSTGDNNTVVGNNAGNALTGSGNVMLGKNAGNSNATANNKLYIENTNSATPLIYGDFSTDSLRFNGAVSIKDGLSLPTGAANGKVLTSDANGKATWETATADNLGNHTASQNIELNSNWLSNDGGNEGIRVANDGKVGVGNATPITELDVNGNIRANGGSLYFGGMGGVNSGYAGIYSNLGSINIAVLKVGAGANLPFASGNNSITAMTIIQTTGRVGIGTKTPGFLLDVNGTASVNSLNINSAFTFPTINGTAGQVLQANAGGVMTWVASTGDNLGNHIMTQNLETNGKYISNDGDSEGIHVDNDGDVTIGATNGFYKLGVRETSGDVEFNVTTESGTAEMSMRSYGSAESNVFTVSRSRGTFGSSATLANNDDIFQLKTSLYNGSSSTVRDAMSISVDGVSGNNIGTRIDFTTANSADGSASERLSILENGQVVIGSSSASSSTPRLQVVGEVWADSMRIRNTVSANGNHTGMYNWMSGTGSGRKTAIVGTTSGGSGDGIGVFGVAQDAGVNKGIRGYAAGGTVNWAGYFDAGNVYIKDTLQIASGSPSSGKILTALDTDGNATWSANILTCPTGFEKVNESYCIEKDERTAASWFAADSTCAVNDYELPGFGDWYSGMAILTLTDETDDNEWVSNISQNNMMVVGSGGIKNRSFQDPNTTASYRCIYKKQ